MARFCGAACGLMVFSAMIFCGLMVGNPIEIIVLRAVGGMFFGLLLGLLAGWVGTYIVRDNIHMVSEENADSETPKGQTGSRVRA